MAGLGDINKPVGRYIGQDAGGLHMVQQPDGSIAYMTSRPDFAPPEAQPVGILGKALGAFGLDADGDRAATSWGDAWRNSTASAPGTGMILPISNDENNNKSLAWPGMATGVAEAGNRLLKSSFDPSSASDAQWAQMARDSFDVAGVAPMGGLAASAAGMVPEGALTSNSVGRAASHLPMDEASRMARAREMGFNVDAYHGTRAPDFASFHPGSHFGSVEAANKRLSDLSELGDASLPWGMPRGDEAREAVYPVKLRAQKVIDLDDMGEWTDADIAPQLYRKGLIGDDELNAAINGDLDTFDWLKSQGYDAVRYRNDFEGAGSPSYMVLDPKNIRSKFAAFDPAQSDSANLLAANSPTGAAAPLAVAASREAGGTAPLVGRPVDLPAQNQMLSHQSGGDPQAHRLDASQGPQGLADHSSMQSDLLKAAYENHSELPDGWYVHGRSRLDHLRDDAPIQATRSFDVMEQYGGLGQPYQGSGWAISPKDGAKVLDLSSIDTPDARAVGAAALLDYRKGLFPRDDLVDGLAPRDASERIRNAFVPDRIVESAQGYDDTALHNWFYERFAPDFVRTPDGAVSLNKDQLNTVRLFSNNANASAAPLAVNALERQIDDVLESVPVGQRWENRPGTQSPVERAKTSQYWPYWGEDHPERAMYHVQEMEAAKPWQALVDSFRFPQGNTYGARAAMERWQAEAEAMKVNPELGYAFQDARRAWKEHDKGRPLTEGELRWESLHQPPGTPPAADDAAKLMDTYARENFMVAGHPDLAGPARATLEPPLPRLGKPGGDLFANNANASAAPLAFSDEEQGFASGGAVTLDDFMKRHEGFAPRAQWDYAQHTNGYGTRARYPGEEISREEAERRFQAEKAQARATVERFAPQLDEGSKAALTDLTFNAGDKWTRSGLGEAVRTGDMARAKSLFLQYTKAGGRDLPGLVKRRQEGAQLFGSEVPDQGPQLAQSAAQGDFFAGKGLSLAGDELPSLAATEPPGMMALGGPKSSEGMSHSASHSAQATPFNAQSYRTSPENQVSRMAPEVSKTEWVQSSLGLMPKWSDGQMPLQGFKDGGRVAAGLGNLSVAKPTDAQKEAGNYKKAHVNVHGLDITIENTKGSERSGVDRDGKRWAVKLPDHYGYFKRTLGHDGDHVDCYVGPDVNAPKAFVIDQVDAETGKFDEHKVMLGYPSEAEARSAYAKAFNDGKASDRLGALTAMPVADLKDWLFSGDTKRPLAPQKFATGGAVQGHGMQSLQTGYSGHLLSDVAGRTDQIPLEVTAGSYVIPADIVSALGESNTLAGTKVLQEMFPAEAPSLQFSSGGRVPIIVAGGEYALSPEQVAKIGGGDLDAGHAALDEWVKAVRAHTIQTLSQLPGPAQ